MIERTLWIIFAVLFLLDLLFIVVRASLVNSRLPQLIALGSTDPRRSIEPTLVLVEKLSLRVAFRFAIAIFHFLLACTVYLLINQYYSQLQLGIDLLIVFLCAFIVLMIEFALEGWVRRNPEPLLVRLTSLGRAIDALFTPFSTLLLALLGKPEVMERVAGAVTEDELKSWVQVGQTTGGLEKGERQMIYSIFHFGDTLCREIMIPRIDILALEVNTTVHEAVQELTQSGHSRIPVYEDSIDNVVGLLYAKDLLRATLEPATPENIRPFLRPAYFVPESKKVDELLREMQSRRVHLAVVVDEYGGMAGLVTLEDIVEEIVGEIRDEYDQGEELLFQQVAPEEFIFHGRIDLDDVNEILGTHLETDLADTLGGYIYGTIGRVPVGGEVVQVDDWQLTVEQVSGRRIRKIHARRQPESINLEESKDDIRP